MSKKTYPQALGDYIYRLREGINPSRRNFALKIGMDPQTVANIEDGKTESPGLQSIVILAEALNVDEAELIAVYKGKSRPPEAQVLSSVHAFIRSLPPEVVAEDVDHQKIFERLVAAKGPDKMRELLQQVVSKRQDKQNG